MAAVLTGRGHSALVFMDKKSFFAAAQHGGAEKIGLVACDFRMVEQDVFDPYADMVAHAFVVPLVFYNDPYAESGRRACYWMAKLRRKLGGYLPEERLRGLHAALADLQEVVNAPDIQPSISLLAPPRRLDAALPAGALDLERVKQIYRIQESKFRVLEYLYRNRGNGLSAQNICQYLWKDSSESKMSTLYAYVSYLRDIFRKDTQLGIDILRDDKSHYKLVVGRLPGMAGSAAPFAGVQEFLARPCRVRVTFQTVSETYRRQFRDPTYTAALVELAC